MGKHKNKNLKGAPPAIAGATPTVPATGKEVWVSDATLLKSIKGTDQTLEGTKYLGELIQE